MGWAGGKAWGPGYYTWKILAWDVVAWLSLICLPPYLFPFLPPCTSSQLLSAVIMTVLHTLMGCTGIVASMTSMMVMCMHVIITMEGGGGFGIGWLQDSNILCTNFIASPLHLFKLGMSLGEGEGMFLELLEHPLTLALMAIPGHQPVIASAFFAMG